MNTLFTMGILLKRSIFALLLLLFMSTSACKSAPQRLFQPDLPPEESAGRARISLYLETVGNTSVETSIRLVKVEIGDGQLWFELPITRLRLKRREISEKQLFLGSALLQPGTFKSLRLTFTEAVVNGSAVLTDGEQREVELPIAIPTPLKPDTSTCLFIDWYAPAEGMGGDLFNAFAARFQTPSLARDLVTVLCRDINTIYQITPDRNRVVAAFGLAGPLGETAFDSHRRRFYVVGTGVRGLYVIDAASNRLVDIFTLPLTQAPAALALSEDGSYAFVSDTITDRILKIDLNNGFVAKESLDNLRPDRIILFGQPGHERLAVTSASERQVTIIKSETLARLSTISINGVPAAVAVLDNYIFIADRESDNVLVYTLADGRFEYYLKVGREPLEMAAFGRRIYVAPSRGNYLSLLGPRQKTPLRRIPCGLGPVDLAISQSWRKLYVANRQARHLSVIDLHSGTGLAKVQLGGRPSVITIWER